MNLRRMKLYNEWLAEGSGEVLSPKRGVPLKFDPRKHRELAEEFYELIRTAYAEIGGHVKINKPNDIFSDPDWNWWQGIDIHGTQDFDLIMFGQENRYGVKFSGVGHDGTSDAKKEFLDSKGRDLKKFGYYVEVSGKLAEILINKYGVPVVNDEKTVEKVLGKPVEWVGKNPDDPSSKTQGWYIRSIGGHAHAKILVGRPKA
jgi:hypothetical protein